MRKLGLLVAAIACFWFSGCSSTWSLRGPQVSDVNIPSPSNTQRTFQADYDTTFRATVDVLRQIDNSSAKLVKRDSGIISFRRPGNAGTITAKVEKVDEQTTGVRLSMAKDGKIAQLDDTGDKTRDAIFAELDKLLGTTTSEESGADLINEAEQSVLPESQTAPQEKSHDDKDPLLTAIGQLLQIEGKGSFLEKLSRDDLSVLEQKLRAFSSITAEKKELTEKCAACFVDLARLHHDAGRYARSAETLKIALTIDPDNAVAHCNLGEIYKHLRLFDDAIRELNEAKRLNPELADTYINLGIIYDDYIIDEQKALGYYKQYLELGGTDEQVLEWIGEIEKDS